MSLEVTFLSFLASLFTGFALGWLVEGVGPTDTNQGWIAKVVLAVGLVAVLGWTGWPIWVSAAVVLALLAGSYGWQFLNGAGVAFKGMPSLTFMFVLFLAPVAAYPVWVGQGISLLTAVVVLVALALAVWFYQRFVSLSGKKSLTDVALTAGVGILLLVLPILLATTRFL